MEYEEFKKICDQPVDLEAAHEALKRFIHKEGVVCVPANPNDDDMLLCRVLDELKKYREVNKHTFN